VNAYEITQQNKKEAKLKSRHLEEQKTGLANEHMTKSS
jgi:hypothetical protein